MTKPILQVADQAKLIAHGNYTQEESIETTSKDEIGELVSNFNIMKKNQKKAEDQIRQNEAFLQSITTYMGEGMHCHGLRRQVDLYESRSGKVTRLDSRRVCQPKPL